MAKVIAEYIWIDGQTPTKKMRSKTKILKRVKICSLNDLPNWRFDGSSTNQAATGLSDCELRPIFFALDPIRGKPHILVLCEVYYEGKPHLSNTRAGLRNLTEKYKAHEPLFGIEQEYTLYDKDGVRPYRWPAGAAFPAPQGRYYCGVGSDEVYGRKLVEAHMNACLAAGLEIGGINAEVMPAQWEFQVGPLGPLEICDQLWLARWLLYRLGEDFGISAKLDPKPIAGDWNGAGAHTNFSTKAMREPGGIKEIQAVCRHLESAHHEHMKVYGYENDKRLTGRHETCDIGTFRWGVGDRGASVRIGADIANAGCGYLEDRRPAANADPYEVCAAILCTVCGNGAD